MNSADIYQYMADPARLSEKTVPDLRQIVSDFPYFHAACMLYLKNLEVVKDVRQQVELKKMAIYIPDRLQLYMLIESDRYSKPVVSQTNELDRAAQSNDTPPPIEDKQKTVQDAPLTYETVSLASTDYAQWLDANSQPDDAHTRLQHQDLIDTFLQEEKAQVQGRKKLKTVAFKQESVEKTPPADNPEKSLTDSYFTETLANIYIKQKRYDRALEIIKSLSLKYPKKNIYFADQIRFLEKLIIHSKK